MADLQTLHKIADNFYDPEDPSGTFSIKVAMEGHSVVVKYVTVVHFAEEKSLQLQTQRANEQAIQLIDSKISDMKSSYREKVGETLRLEDLGGNDNIELISVNPNTPRKVAYYRYSRNYVVQE
tara:strand:+ start:68 stop:436 length:369 start_codon:yes stop_codon:yes gene_type:complete